jgi:hypothetical protein
MSRFTSAQRQGILAEARANIAERANLAERESASPRQPEIIYKTRHDAPAGDADDGADLAAAAASAYASGQTGADEPWWRWVEKHLEYSQRVLTDVMGEVVARLRSETHDEVETLKRELEVTRRELTSCVKRSALNAVLNRCAMT